jgi:ASC-1-like (ASCH) protein
MGPEHFNKIKQGKQKSEVRFSDRNFNAGDTLVLREYDPVSLSYTGRSIKKK